MGYKLNEKREELKAKQKALATIFEAAGPEMDLDKVEGLKAFDSTHKKAAEIKRLNDELTALGQEVDDLVAVEKTASDVAAMGEGMKHTGEAKGKGEIKTFGQLFVESAAYKGRAGGRSPVATLDVDVKTLMTTAAGWAPETIRMPGYIPSAQRIPTVTDIIPQRPTNQAAIVYMVESTFTNNAAERAEGANNAGEAALALTPTTSTVRQIAVWLPVTQEQMDDVAYINSYVNDRMGLMIRQRLSSQVLVGNGIAPNLAGLIGMAGVQTQALGADPVPDAIYKAMTLVRVTGRAEPNAIVMHPNDWQDIRLLRTVDGVYIWGSPAEAGPERIWGLPVIQDSACTENTAVVGDYANYSELAMRQGIEVDITDSHASLFIQMTLAVRAHLRVAFVVYRPAAFCQVTGI